MIRFHQVTKQNSYDSFKGAFLLSSVSSPWDCSKCFTFHPQADLFIPTPSRLLWEAFSHATITARRPFVHISTCAVARYSFIQLSELWQCGMNEIAKASKRQQEDSNMGSLNSESNVLTTAPPCPVQFQPLYRDQMAIRQNINRTNIGVNVLKLLGFVILDE